MERAWTFISTMNGSRQFDKLPVLHSKVIPIAQFLPHFNAKSCVSRGEYEQQRL